MIVSSKVIVAVLALYPFALYYFLSICRGVETFSGIEHINIIHEIIQPTSLNKY